MSQVLEAVVHRFGKHVRVNGRLCLSSNGDQVLASVFTALGWSDPHPLDVAWRAPVVEAATVEAPERAVLKPSKGRLG